MATLDKHDTWQELVLDGTITVDWEAGDTIKVMLITSAAAPVTTTDDYINDVSANEVSGTNYTAGGDALSNTSVVRSGATSTVDADDTTWLQNASGFTTARYAVVYKDTGTPATSPIFFSIDLTTDRGNVNGDFTLQWNASGLFTQA